MRINLTVSDGISDLQAIERVKLALLCRDCIAPHRPRVSCVSKSPPAISRPTALHTTEHESNLKEKEKEKEEREKRNEERGKRNEERGKRKEKRGKRKEERGKRNAERGKRKEKRGKRKEERGKRKEERGKRKEERCHFNDILQTLANAKWASLCKLQTVQLFFQTMRYNHAV